MINMGLFDFFKKKKIEQFQELSFKEINNFIKDKEREFLKREEELINLINNKALILISELKDGITNLEKINLEEKKEQPKLKKLTLEGRDILIDRLNELIEELNKISHQRIHDFIRELNQSFDNFHNKSKIGFEKVKILIGKEIALIESSLKKFSNEFSQIILEDKNYLNSISIIGKIKNKLDEINKETLNIEGLEKEINNLKEEIKINKVRINKNKSKLQELKNSSEYKNEILKGKELENNKIKLKDNLSSLKNLINFKKLMRENHSIEKNMKVIKGYKEKFSLMFEEDKGEFLKNNIKDSNLENKIEDILLLEKIIKNFKIEKINFDLFEKEILNLEYDIERLNKNIEKLNKNKDNLNDLLNSLKISLVELFKEIKIDLTI
ncbi:MAG: hypothetical protein WC260_03175 [Candidatus Pacearchaeota archaeon]